MGVGPAMTGDRPVTAARRSQESPAAAAPHDRRSTRMDDATQTAEDGVYRLIYRSRSRIPAQTRRAELGELFTAARAHNKGKKITGALLLVDEVFVHTLEGDEQEVQALLARIRADTRHDRIEILDTSLVDSRVFARWAMAKVADTDDQPDINLIAHEQGIHAAASRGDATPEQEGVLKVMRDAARGRALT